VRAASISAWISSGRTNAQLPNVKRVPNVSKPKSTVRTQRINAPEKLVERARRLASGSPSGERKEQALQLLRQAASSGSAEANYAIGTWYAFGDTLPQDYKRAALYFKRAARKGYGPALYDLAYSHEAGLGVRKDLGRAFKLYVRAAREGDLDGAKSVYRCVYHGIGIDRDRTLAELIADFYDGTFERKLKQLRHAPRKHQGTSR
jgi:uncharacterized protein